MPPITDRRPSPLAGLWYPDDPDDLAAMVEGFLSEADPAVPDGPILGLMAPHAGLRYSGPVAAYSFKLLQKAGMADRIQTVAILSPYHRPPHQLYNEAVVTTVHDAYETPLGVIPVDRAAIKALGEHIRLAAVRCDQEHAVEIELPFLQRVLPEGFKLLPLMLIDQSPETAQALGQALAAILPGRNALLIASTDLSHFFSQEVAHRLDQRTLDSVRAFAPGQVLAAGKSAGEGACGRAALAAVMVAARELGANATTILRYATSGDTGGDVRQVVGYAAGAFYRKAV